jgi:hypothetical protein
MLLHQNKCWESVIAESKVDADRQGWCTYTAVRQESKILNSVTAIYLLLVCTFLCHLHPSMSFSSVFIPSTSALHIFQAFPPSPFHISFTLCFTLKNYPSLSLLDSF